MKLTNRDCIIDVGANEGDFAVHAASLNPEILVLAFEPIPQLASLIESRARQLGLQNLIVRCEAVLDVPGTLQLNIANHADMGVSSLLSFNSENISKDDYWRTRTDLYHEEQIEVQVSRLDRILEELQIDNVLFIKVDAQGVDLRVLSSLGDFKPLSGMLESATTRSKALYLNEPDLTDTLRSLREGGFVVWDIKPNDPACAEVNVFFARSNVDFRELETNLALMKIGIYGSKHYWFSHSSRADGEKIASTAETLAGMTIGTSESASLHRRVSQYRRQTLETLQELANLKLQVIQLDHATEELDKVLNSKSWRWTSLIRQAASIFTRGR